MRCPRPLAVAVVLLAAAAGFSGCAAWRPAGSGGGPSTTAGSPAEPARRLQAGGKPFYILSVGAPSAGRPAAPAVPFSYAEETAGRWLVLFELSYPAGEGAGAAPAEAP